MSEAMEPSATQEFREVEHLLEGIEAHRRMQNASDQRLGIVRHQFDAPVSSLKGMEVYGGANPRKNPKIRSRVARQIRESLLNRDGVQDAFHLAHLGITVVATEFVKVEGREDAFRLKFKLDLSDEPEDGIVNGLHTMAVIEDLLREEVEISPNQYVSFTVITGIADEDRTTLVPFIAKGRNTVLQVKEESIDNLMGRFDALKAAIEPMPYGDRIGWEESANRDYDVLDVLAIMTALNPILYPNETNGGGELTHPIIAADHKRGCLRRFDQDQESYDKLAHLLPDMLHLYDLVRSDARDRYNETGKGKRGGRLRIMTSKKRKDGSTKDDALFFPFLRIGKASYGRQGTWELVYPATFAILAAFRNFLTLGEDGKYQWKGGVEAVEKAWQDLGAELVIACHETAVTLPEHKMAVLLGRNRPLWTVLHKTVREYLTRQESDQRTAELEAEIERLRKLTNETGSSA
jgi:AIPR protein